MPDFCLHLSLLKGFTCLKHLFLQVSFITLVMNGVTDPVLLLFIVVTLSIFVHSQLYHGNPYLMP